jgi:ABC-type sugar transport system permease subunit
MATTGMTPQTHARTAWRESLLFVFLIGPNLALFFIFTYWPLIYNAYLSMVNWNFVRPRIRWVGLSNYINLFSSSQFWIITWNTVVFTLFSVGLTLLLGLAVALLINQPLRWRDSARAILFSPVVMSGAVIAVVWAYLFDPRSGLVGEFLRLVNLNSPDFLNDPFWAMPAVITVYVWKNVGYAVVIYLAGLQSISRELYDAARVDGAGAWARFRHVTLPGLSPIAFFLAVTSIISCFQAFDLIRVLTNGGPALATTTLIYYLYELGFASYDAGKAGVVAMVLFTIMLILTIVQVRYLERRVTYG